MNGATRYSKFDTRNTCTQQRLSKGERFENANICIFPTFTEIVGSHLKPNLPVVVMATLNQFNSNLFVVSVNNSPLAKISQYISIHTLQPQLHSYEFY